MHPFTTDDALNMVKGSSNYKVNVLKICQKKVAKEVFLSG